MLKDCESGGRFRGTVLITEWKETPFRNKIGSFITMTCQDCTGSASAKIWEIALHHVNWLQNKDVFYVEANVSDYRGYLELNIESIQPVNDEDIDLTNLLPSSPLSDEVLEQRLKSLSQRIKDKFLIDLLTRILEHPEAGVAFRRAPAAIKIHQPYLRGLLEHSVGVAETAHRIATIYPEINFDLVLVAALLHDIGKIYEYSYERSLNFTTEGRLLGHIMLGVDLVSREMAQIPDFPNDLRLKILHIITSHHGRYEWQSPKRPKCMEAVIVHYADALEADLWQFKHAKKEHPEARWSPYVKHLERHLFLE